MNQRPNRPLSPPRTRWFAPLAALATLALLLAWWQPWRTPGQPAPSRPTAIPIPPTATRAPERIALPTTRPPLPATPAIAAIPATPATPPTVASTDSGTLLYLGTADGHTGIVAANPDGSAPRLLAPGFFDQIAPSPDGTRLATVGTIPGGDGSSQIAIFDTTGRALARYSVGIGTSHPLRWSPSGRYLLHTILVNGQPQTRVLTDTAIWDIPQPAANAPFPDGWTPDDRIAYFAHLNPNQSTLQTLWTIDATGHDPQQHLTADFSPVAWNYDGSLFYYLDTYSDQLLALDMRFGSPVYITSPDALLAEVLGTRLPPRNYRFAFVTLSPDATIFALGLYQVPSISTPTPRADTSPGYIVFMRTFGRITGVAQLTTTNGLGPSLWSPNASRFALFTFTNQSPTGQLQVFDPTGNATAFTVERAYAGTFPQAAWSPDGSRLAYTSAQGLMLTAFDPHRTQLIAPGAAAPTWQPSRPQTPAHDPRPCLRVVLRASSLFSLLSTLHSLLSSLFIPVPRLTPPPNRATMPRGKCRRIC